MDNLDDWKKSQEEYLLHASLKSVEKVFRPFFLVYKNDVGLSMSFFDTLFDLYDFLFKNNDIISYSVFRTLEIKNGF